MQFRNRITDLLGIEIPVVQAPMGWIARSQLASAVSNAGGLGVIEISSGELDVLRDEIRKMRVSSWIGVPEDLVENKRSAPCESGSVRVSQSWSEELWERL